MAAALVGSIGAVSQGAAGAAVTPAWGAGANRTAGNMLICSVTVTAVATLPATPAGWTLGSNRLGTSCAAAIYYKVATGGDAAPTLAAVTSGVISAQLQEVSGLTTASPASDRGSTQAGTTTPIVATNSTADLQSGEWIVAAAGVRYSQAATKTTSHTINNATDTEVSNDATSSRDHYNFTRGVTTANASPDSDSFAFTATQITGAVVVLQSFKLAPVAPTATTDPATAVNAQDALLNSTINPNGASTDVSFEYGLTTAYGTTTASTNIGGGNAAVASSRQLVNLTPNTTYHFRVKAVNSVGTTYGADRTFTTPDLTPPIVTTDPASMVTSSTADLNGTVQPNGKATNYWFEYGTDTSYGSTTPSTGIGSTGTYSPVESISGLTPSTTYHFRLVAQNPDGITYGADRTFTTASAGDTTPPTVTITAQSRTRMSRVPGFDATDITYQADEAFDSYEVRLVPTVAATRAEGTLIESGALAGAANTAYTVTITDDELVAAAGVEGNNIIAVYVRDAAGNWSGAGPLVLPFNLPATLTT